MENPFELLIEEWEARKVLDKLTLMTCPYGLVILKRSRKFVRTT